nr:hypothetical protein [Tanacetum cinerariifolium]
MHIEKNVFENLFETVMDIEGKTKDNAKARDDVKIYCKRKELEKNESTGKYPKSCYTLGKDEKKVVCYWVSKLKFPDGYVSNMARCVDMKKIQDVWFLGKLKKKVTNKSKVESSIANAYLIEETSMFCSHYFEPHVKTKMNRLPRNDDGGDEELYEGTISIFRIFIEEIMKIKPNLTDVQVDTRLKREFANWFNDYARDSDNVDSQIIKDVASGPLRKIVQLEYPSLPIKRVVLFRCDRFDPTPNVGMKVHKGYNLVDVNHKRRFNKYEPFILASQSSQVYYTSYPSLRRDKVDWWALSKAKPRSFIDFSVTIRLSKMMKSTRIYLTMLTQMIVMMLL